MVRYTVTILRKGQLLKKIFTQESFSVGRSLDCDLSLDDLGVSRVQLVVTRKGSQIWIEDKNSSNGTYLNQTRILQSKPVNVVPTDSIQLGKSDYILSIDLELDELEHFQSLSIESPEEPPTMETEVPEEPEFSLHHFTSKEVIAMPFVMNSGVSEVSSELGIEMQATPVMEEDPAEIVLKAEEPLVVIEEPVINPVVEATVEAEPPTPERLLHAARKQATQIIYEGEAQAEKRVQGIYRKAQEVQTAAEAEAKEKITSAHKKADQLLADYQQQGQDLLKEARAMAQELREEVEVFAESLKEKARRESETSLKESREKAEHEGKLVLEKKQAETEELVHGLISKAEKEAHDLVHFAQMQSEEYKISLVEAQRKSESSVKECARIEEELKNIQGRYAEEESRQNNLLTKIKADEENLSQVIKDLSEMRAEKAEMENKMRILQEKEADLQRNLLSMDEKVMQAQQKFEGQKGELEKALHIEKMKVQKEASEYGQHLKLEFNKKMHQMEEELFRSLVEKRNSLGKEIFNLVEKRVVEIVEPAKWTAICQSTHQDIQEVIENKLVSFSQAASNDQKPVDLKTKKRSEATRWAAVGMCCGVVAFFLSTKLYGTMTQDQTMVQRQIASENQARQADLEKRKFTPAQADELKESYTDSVIYTRDYPAKYLNPAFQEKLFKSSSAYLLKTWRVDEERALQTVSAAAALVKELSEKRQGLHPDFIKDGIAKMRVLEQQSAARMKEILGSEVRFESYKKFERKFYEENRF